MSTPETNGSRNGTRQRARGRVRRIPILVVLAVLIVAAVLAGERDRPATAQPRVAREAAATSRTRSTAWFCPGAPTAIADETERITIANTGSAPARTRITLYRDGGGAAIIKPVAVAGRATVTVPRAEIGPRGAFTVETESADVVVESGADGAGALAFGPCASSVSTHWFFAAGTTVRGVDQWLVVYNPLGTDAKIDLTLRTETGAHAPIEYQARDVARRSRLIVPIHDLAGRSERVAVEVRARVGLVVAQQTNVFGANSGLQGVTQSLGALAPAVETWFSDGAPRPGIVVAIANPGPVDAQVEVRGYPDGDAIVPPVSITIPREGVSFVPVGGCAGTPDEECIAVPTGAPYALSVIAEDRTPVVAEVFERAPKGDVPGAAVTTGVSHAARSWLFARSRATDGTGSIIALVNPGVMAGRVDITFVHDGTEVRPAALQHVAVPPARRVAVDLGAVAGLDAADSAIIIRSSVPIGAERSFYGAADMTRTAGIAAP